MHCQEGQRKHGYMEKGASISQYPSTRVEMAQGDGRIKFRKNPLSVLNSFQVVDCHPKILSLQQAARNGTSQRNVLSCYRKQHITASGFENSTLHEVTKFWGQHSHSLGVKLTPQLDQENMYVCAHTHSAYVQACAHECA